MVWSILSPKRRRDLSRDARLSRSDESNLVVAWCAVIVYNLVGVSDIVSTVLGLARGAEEINPLLRLAMDNLGPGWIAAKLLLQGVISFMVLWFPHRIVLGIFIAAIAFNAWVVYGNFSIVYGW